MVFKRNFCKKDNCRKMFKILKNCINAKNIFLLSICICQGIHFKNLIDKKYVPNPNEVDLLRIEGICEKFELIAVVLLQEAAPSAVSYAH